MACSVYVGLLEDECVLEESQSKLIYRRGYIRRCMSFFRGDKQKREGKPYLQKGGSEKKRKMGKGSAPGSMGSRQLCSFVSRRAHFRNLQ